MVHEGLRDIILGIPFQPEFHFDLRQINLHAGNEGIYRKSTIDFK